MLEEAADEQKGFQGAKTVLVSSTVSPAAVRSRALNAKAVPPIRHPLIWVSASWPASIRTLAASKKGFRFEATRTVLSVNEALDRPLWLIGSRRILMIPATRGLFRWVLIAHQPDFWRARSQAVNPSSA
jgi:hypothetical protein